MTQNQATPQVATPDFFARIEADGCVVTYDNNQLHLGDTADNYCVNVYRSLEYIVRRWPAYLEIVEVVDLLGTHQDAVFLRRIREEEARTCATARALHRPLPACADPAQASICSANLTGNFGVTIQGSRCAGSSTVVLYNNMCWLMWGGADASQRTDRAVARLH